MADARAHELREGATRAARPRLPRGRPRALSRRPGGRQPLTGAPAALEFAEQACRAASGDAVDALVHRERSGFARYAGSNVHQPTLVDDQSVTIRVVREGKVGAVGTNRTDAAGLRDAARRAEDAADNARPDPGFPGLAPPAPVPDVSGWDEETASLPPEELAAR